MIKKELICVICPNGCQLEADVENTPAVQVREVRGHLCEKGPTWAEQEIVNPIRSISSSIRVTNGNFPLVSVRTDSPIALKSIRPVMDVIKAISIKAPVHMGDVLIKNPADTSCNIIATRNVNSR